MDWYEQRTGDPWPDDATNAGHPPQLATAVIRSLSNRNLTAPTRPTIFRDQTGSQTLNVGACAAVGLRRSKGRFAVFEFLVEEMARIKTRKFHLVDGPASPELQRAIEKTDLLLPPSYKEFRASVRKCKAI